MFLTKQEILVVFSIFKNVSKSTSSLYATSKEVAKGGGSINNNNNNNNNGNIIIFVRCKNFFCIIYTIVVL